MFKGKILLASQSPRRKELLELAGIDFRIVSADIEEQLDETIPPSHLAENLALLKAKAVVRHMHKDEIILAADTIVVKGKRIFGKPIDKLDAINILKQLSGTEHEVITGVCLKSSVKERTFSVTTKVFFNLITSDQIEYYVDCYKPFDKAGAYAIQEWIGLIGIKKIEGCYFNVVGLPVSSLWEELKNF